MFIFFSNILYKLINSPILIKILSVIISFIANVFINRSLGIVLKGQLTTISNYAMFGQMLLNLGVCYAYSKLKLKYDDKTAKDILVAFIWLDILFVAIFGSTILYFIPMTYKIYIAILCIAMVCNSHFMFCCLIDNIKYRNYVLLTSTSIYVMSNIYSYLFLPGNLDIIIFFMTIKLIVEIILIGLKNNYFHINIACLKLKYLKEVIKVSIPTAIMSVLISCNYNINIMMLDIGEAGDLQLGIYGVAFMLTNMMWFIPDAFKEMVYSRSVKEKDLRFVLNYILINFLLCFCVCIGFAFLGKRFLNIVYGDEYVIAFDTTMVLFLGILPMIAFKLIHPIYVNNGETKQIVLLLSITIAINCILGYVLIPMYGALGAAWACVGSYSVCGILVFIKFYKEYCVF